ncbi:hypothetical protein IAR55_002207 [Kwoniella newhampshirensis]|uniref:Glycogen storage control protein n=1 Tax=Kwoniella newhampshirensis TaxID=1651941 RepID=A0AAW0Z0X5_9TREE
MTGENELQAQSERHTYPPSVGVSDSERMSASGSTRTSENEAGPSRSRRPSQGGHAEGNVNGEGNDNVDTRHKSDPTPLPHLDIATYPTQQLLRLLAGLLQQIATANDQLRPDSDAEEESDQPRGDHAGGGGAGGSSSTSTQSRPHSRSSVISNAASSSSPTTELFHHTSTTARPAHSRSSSIENLSPSLADYPLFSASKASLSHPSSLLAFHARHIPSISIEAYLLRILKYCPTTNEVFLGLLVYFDRMTRLGTPLGVGGAGAGVGVGLGKGKGFAIDSYNVHRLVIAGVTVASKFFSDVFYTNSRYAKVGGLPPTELNSLELQFLLLNDFRLRISVEEMQRYGDRLLAYAEEEDREVDESTSISESYRRDRDRRSRGEETKATPSSAASAPTVQDAHAASTLVKNATSDQEQDDNRMQVDPKLSESESQPAVAPDHPSAPNSAPASRRGSASASTTVPTPSQPHPPQSQSQTYPPPNAPVVAHSSSATNGATSSAKDKDVNGNIGEPHSHAVPSGLRDWARGEEVMNVVGGRMTSPMRD